MTPVMHASAEFRVSSMGNGKDQPAGPVLVTRDATGFDRERFNAETGRLRREIERLQQENEDLRKSAEIWIRLYERQLTRAKGLIDQLAACAKVFPR